MKSTSLTEKHIALGAKMVPFAGYNMPVSYEGIKVEHHAVRNSVGMFDVSHMGEFKITGSGALDLIQYVTSNDAAKLTDGKVQYSCLPNGKGGIVDDLLVYRVSEDDYLLVVNASNIEKDWNWIKEHNTFGAEMEDISEQTSLLAVQGPNAAKVLKSLCDLDLENMEYYSFGIGKFAGFDNVVVSATGYTGAGGFEIYLPNEAAPAAWDAILEAGKAYDIKPAGLGCRDTLRLEMGFCLYGNDINDTTSPIAAGLGWITKFTKDFIDKDVLADHKANGVAQKLVAFEMMERGIPRQHYRILNAAGEPIGEVTSGSESPTTGKLIGLGYVDIAFSKAGSEIFIDIRNKGLRASVVKLPFINQ